MNVANNKVFKQKNVSSTSNGHFSYNQPPKNSLRAKMQHIVEIIAVRVTVGSLDTLIAAACKVQNDMNYQQQSTMLGSVGCMVVAIQ